MNKIVLRIVIVIILSIILCSILNHMFYRKEGIANKPKYKTKSGIDKAFLLNSLKDAYNNGTNDGVLISMIIENEKDLDNDIYLDGSATLLRKGKDLHMSNTFPENWGYIWDPVDNLSIAQCTYVDDAFTTSRKDDKGELDRCGNKLLPNQTMCGKGNCLETLVEKSRQEYKKDTSEPGTRFNEVVIMRKADTKLSYSDVQKNPYNLKQLPAALAYINYSHETDKYDKQNCIDYGCLWDDRDYMPMPPILPYQCRPKNETCDKITDSTKCKRDVCKWTGAVDKPCISNKECKPLCLKQSSIILTIRKFFDPSTPIVIIDRILPTDGDPYLELKQIISLKDIQIDNKCARFPSPPPPSDIDDCNSKCEGAKRSSVGDCLICATRKCNLKGDEAIDKFCQKPAAI